MDIGLIHLALLLSLFKAAGHWQYVNLFSEHVNMKKGGDSMRHWGVDNNLDLLHMPESPSLETK